MKIITLGTSHGDHTYCRFNSSTLFEVDGGLYLVDAGAPVEGLLVRQGMRISDLKAVFITHMHNDHVGGLAGIYKAFIKYPVGGENLRVFLSEAEGVEPLVGWLKAQHLPWPSDMVEIGAVEEGADYVYRDDVMTVKALRTMHMKEDPQRYASYAYLLEAEGQRVLYSGDLSYDFSEFPAIAANNPCDVCVCECTHFDMAEAFALLAKCAIKKLILNHVGDRWHGDGEVELAKLAESVLPFPCVIAHDGDEFDV